MIGWRARLGFMVPPGNPTVEAEMIALAPEGVSVHFQRMVARATPGSLPGDLGGQDERNRSMVESLDTTLEMLAQVKPDIVVLAHTATSYYLGREREAALVERLRAARGIRVITAFGSVAAALQRLGVRRVSFGAPYSAETTAQGCAHLTAHGYEIVKSDHLKGISNIYDSTAEDAYRLARNVDVPEAEAVFLSGTGMPTLPVLDLLEQDLRKPVLSSATAMMWHALRQCGVRQPIHGFGRLLTLE